MSSILTTHVGSLPRGPELTPLLLARDHGQPYDVAEFDRVVQAAVDEAVAKQEAAGVSLMSDGELGKVGYSTYITERLSGFGGDISRKPALDLAPYPELRKKLAAIMGDQEFVRASCIGPVKLVNLEPCLEDIRRFQKALKGNSARGFMNAASPGLITAFQPNAYYPSHEAYLADLVEAMRPEYEAIAATGVQLQLDCPDLAMSRHTGYQSLTEAEFLKIAEANVEALNAATRNIPPEQLRMHVCWGNYEGPHHFDVALKDIIDIVFSARPSMLSMEGANPRHAHEWAIFEDIKLPEGKKLIPGVLESKTNFIEHPELVAQRLERYAQLVGPQNVMAGTDCGYGTWVGQAAVDPDIVFAKFSAMAEGAGIARAKFK